MAPAPARDYTRPAVVLDIHDGDTVKLAIRLKKAPRGWKNEDLTFHFHVEDGWLVLHTNIRLLGNNSEELATPGGQQDLAYFKTLLSVGEQVHVRSALASHVIDSDKYGDRWLGVILSATKGDVNALMRAAGHATAWDGKGTKPVPAGPPPPQPGI